MVSARVSELEESIRPSPDTLAKSLMLAGNAPRLALVYATGEFLAQRMRPSRHFDSS